ncbi:MAG: hypothetical protein HGA55_07350, partial [Methanoregulaceae archaeon]|nr:hypothetical protein [Methanoregulaceae archaeon]
MSAGRNNNRDDISHFFMVKTPSPAADSRMGSERSSNADKPELAGKRMTNFTKKGSRLFRYYPEDFGEPVVRVLHMNLLFDIFDDHTFVNSRLHGEVLETPLHQLVLNAKELEILSVSCDASPVAYAYDRDSSLLSVLFEREMPPGTRFTISTETVCYPSDHVLEGLYYDRTPPGAPPTQITQCQQWGFQRLVP